MLLRPHHNRRPAGYNPGMLSPNNLPTSPTAVTVFPDRARVTRTGTTSLQPGIQRLEVAGLPLSLLADSVRAAGRGTARARLIGVSVQQQQFAESPAEIVRALEKQIESLEDSDADLAAQIDLVDRELQNLNHLGAQGETFARGLALRSKTPADQAEIFGYIAQRGRALQGEGLSLSRQRREAAREIDRLRRELQVMHSARPLQRFSAIVELDVSAAGDFTLELTYVVMGASWQPLYDLRLEDTALELTYLADVTQNTGEDWHAVELILSTARPSLALVIPELKPWYVQPFVPRPVPVARSAGPTPRVALPASALPAPSAAGPEAAPAPQELAFDAAQVSQSGASLTYRLAGRSDVPGNGDPRKVTVASVSLAPDITYVTAPKLEPVCYRRAEVKNTSPYSLLPGAAQLFESDDYLGATRLDFVAPGQVFELALGADERLRVEREMIAREVDKAFIIGDRRRIRYAFRIEVENLRDSPQVVYVRDHAPVARDEQIKVKIDNCDPKPSEQTELNGLDWKLTLDRGARRQIRFDFSVEHPRAMNVIGLP
jgi:uncharacterized protein (TIGR02231 family)